MNLDFEKALTFVANDKEWGNKILAGSGIMLLGYAAFIFPVIALALESWGLAVLFLAISMIIFALCQFAILGYGCEVAQSFIKNPQETVLPNWKNFRHLMFLGFKYSVGAFLLMLPLLLLYILGMLVFVIGLVNTDSAVSALFSTFLMLSLVGIGSVVYLFVLLFLPLFGANFMKELKISSFINVKQAFGLLKGHGLDYVIMYLLFIALSCILATVVTILFCTIIGIIFLPVLYFYGYLVFAQLCAQFINLPDKVSENSSIEPSQE